MKKWIEMIFAILFFIAIVLIIVFMGKFDKSKVVYSQRSIVDVNVSELVEDDWFDYSYFWQAGKDENGHDLTIVTIYWSKVNEEGMTTYVTDGKTWEKLN